MHVGEAREDQMEAILRQSHAAWGEGLTPDQYVAYNLGQKRTRWGRERYRFLIATDGEGGPVSSLKLYTLPAELDGRRIVLAGVGAVFTPEAHRGRGYAARLVEEALGGAGGPAGGAAASAGAAAALLMSEIGGDYYERLGFAAIPQDESGCLPFLPAPWPGVPAWVDGPDPESVVPGLRPHTDSDLDDLAAIHEESTRGQRFRLLRDRSAWEHLVTRLALGERLGAKRLDRIDVVERGGRVVAYAAWRQDKGGLEWREHGARLGDEEALVDLFWLALARARARGVNRMIAWQVPAVVRTRRLYPVAIRPQHDPVVMLRPLAPGPSLPAFASPEECRLSWLDRF